MSGLASEIIAPVRIKLPATSANLGAGFDAAAVAFNRYLEIEAAPAPEFSIQATGRDAERCSQLNDNLILEVYKSILCRNDRAIVPLALKMENGIPLGMGLGSSAAGRLAAIALANHFGELGWSSERILEEACALEGHPDNAAACWLGGFVIASCEGRAVHVARVTPPAGWRPIIVVPEEPLATTEARSVLPAGYSRADVVVNLQSVGLLGLAFAQNRPDLLRLAMRDRIHQPYRASICPLLGRLLPLAGRDGILGVALSGAGPSVLAIAADDAAMEPASKSICSALDGFAGYELLACRFERRSATRAS
jgi:homoserine kinase